MKTNEYMGEVMPDGHISLPDSVVKNLGLRPHVKVKVSIERAEIEEGKNRLSYETKKKALAIKEGISKNSDFFVRARKRRAQNRSVYGIHEDSSTELTQLSRKKCIFRGAQEFISDMGPEDLSERFREKYK